AAGLHRQHMAALMDENGIDDGAGGGEGVVERERAEARDEEAELDELRALDELHRGKPGRAEPGADAARARTVTAGRERHDRDGAAAGRGRERRCVLEHRRAWRWLFLRRQTLQLDLGGRG